MKFDALRRQMVAPIGSKLTICAAGLLSFLAMQRVGSHTGRRDVVQTLLYPDQNATLTYGLGLVLLTGALVGTAWAQVDEFGQSSGRDPLSRVLIALANAVWLCLLLRLAVLVGGGAAGLLNNQVGSTFHSALVGANIFRDQWQLVVMYLIAAAMGLALGFLARNVLVVTGVCLVATIPFIPASQTVVGRATGLISVLPFTPLGALRAASTGTAGIFGNSLAFVRPASPGSGSAMTAAWTAVLMAALAWRLSRRSFPGLPVWSAIGLSVAALCALSVGYFVPNALAHDVPWQWRPDWRAAQKAGWSSDLVVERWIHEAEQGRIPDKNLYASSQVQPVPEAMDACRLPATVDIRLGLTPQVVNVTLHFRPSVRSGPATVNSAFLQFSLIKRNGHYLIAGMSVPAPLDIEVVRR